MSPMHRTLRRARLFALAALAAASSAASAQTTITATWEGGDGNWAEGLRWAPDGVPQNQPGEVLYIARVDGGNSARSRVEIDGTFAIFGLQHSADDRLTLLGTSSLLITGNGFENNGDLRIEAPIPGRGSFTTRLGFLNSTDLKGSGQVTIGGEGFDNALLIAAPGAVLTNADTHTIGGSGYLLQDNGALINQGLVEANDPSLLLRLQPGNAQNLPGGVFGNVINTGTLLATEGGTLALIGTVMDNDGGIIGADANSNIAFAGVTMRGGNVNVDPTGRAEVTESTSNAFSDVTFTGNVTQFSGSSALLIGTTTLSGTEWEIGAAGAAGMFVANGARIEGTGTLRLASGGASALFAGIPVARGEARGATEFTLASGVEIAGSGQLLDGTGNIINEGKIVGDDADARLFIRPASRLLNLGDVVAETTFGIEFDGARIEQTFAKGPSGRLIAESTGDRIILLDSGVLGGRMEGSGTFILRTNTTLAAADRGAPIEPPISHLLSGVVIDTNVQQEGGVGVRVDNTVTVDGNWTLENDLPSAITFEDGAVLTGNGTVTAVPNAHFFRAAQGARFTFTGDSFTFRGAGSFLDGDGTFENTGTFESIGSDPALVVSPEDSQPCTNTGIMRAATFATLLLARGSYDNTGGLMVADLGGQVQLGNGVTVTGGVLQGLLSGGGGRGGANDGLVRVFSDVTLRDVALIGRTNFEPEQDGVSFRVGGMFQNFGNMRIEGVNTETTIFFDDGTEISGEGGEITSLGNRIRIRESAGRILAPITPTVKLVPDPTADPDTASMSIGAGQTVNGGIQFFEGDSGLTSAGLLRANQPADFIVQPNGLGFLNEGEIEVENTSAFRVLGASGAFNNMDSTPGSLDGGTYTIAGIFQTPDAIRTVGREADVTLRGPQVQLQDSAETDTTDLLAEVAEGGSLTLSQGFKHSTGETFANNGALRIAGSASIDAANFEQDGAGASLAFDSGSVGGAEIALLGGTVTGVGGLFFATTEVFVDGATLSPGAAGTNDTEFIETFGGLRFGPAGTMEVDVVDAFTFDRVTSNGDVTLGGTLRVRLAAPAAAGDRYLIIPATGAVSGRFDQFEIEGEATGLQAKTEVSPDGVVLVFTAKPSGFSVH